MSKHPITLADCSEAFAPDGSLLDICMLDTTVDDWQRFIKFLENSSYELTFSIGDKLLPVPENVRQIFVLREEDTACLSISIRGLRANCFFFYTDEIELDIDPKDVISERNFRDLMDFVSALGQALAKEARITPENLHGEPLFLFALGNSEVTYLAPGRKSP